MYPPRVVKNVTEWLEALLPSLGRAGLEFSEDIGLDEDEEDYEVTVRLRAPIPQAGWEALREYITTYSFLCGWRVENLRHTGAKLIFTASRA